MLFYVLAIVALAIVDGLVGTFSEEAEIGLVQRAVRACDSPEPRRDGAPTARHRSQRLVGRAARRARARAPPAPSRPPAMINLIPIVGALVLLVFTVLDSQPGANRFGPNPKGVMGPGTPSPSMSRDLDR